MIKQPQPLIGAAYDSLVVVVSRIKDKHAFLQDEVLQDATLMRLLEAGECLARVRDSHKEYYETNHSHAWNSLIGLRNIIAHGYAQIDHGKVWDIVQDALPNLITELEKLI